MSGKTSFALNGRVARLERAALTWHDVFWYWWEITRKPATQEQDIFTGAAAICAPDEYTATDEQKSLALEFVNGRMPDTWPAVVNHFGGRRILAAVNLGLAQEGRPLITELAIPRLENPWPAELI